MGLTSGICKTLPRGCKPEDDTRMRFQAEAKAGYVVTADGITRRA
jgi:hypothetical protein